MTQDAPPTLESIDILKILECLPQRYPFLMVDRIIQMNGDESCIGIKNVTYNEPHFMGHFPGNPIMPGVLIMEGMAQTAGALCITALGGAGQIKNVFFMTIDKAKFRKLVVPGDVLEYHMTKIAKKRNIWWFRGEAMVSGQVMAEAELGAMLTGA